MDEPKDLDEFLDAVTDEASYLALVEALIRDRELQVKEEPNGPAPHSCGQGSRGWYNHTIEDFLEAGVAWARSTNIGASQGLGEASPWRRFAIFLYCGKIYE